MTCSGSSWESGVLPKVFAPYMTTHLTTSVELSTTTTFNPPGVVSAVVGSTWTLYPVCSYTAVHCDLMLGAWIFSPVVTTVFFTAGINVLADLIIFSFKSVLTFNHADHDHLSSIFIQLSANNRQTSLHLRYIFIVKEQEFQNKVLFKSS